MVARLNAFQRSRAGVGMNMSARGKVWSALSGPTHWMSTALYKKYLFYGDSAKFTITLNDFPFASLLMVFFRNVLQRELIVEALSRLRTHRADS